MKKEKVAQHVDTLASRISRHSVSVFAAQATFFMIISAVPFLMLVMSVTRLAISLSADEVIKFIESAMPYLTHRMVEQVIYEIFSQRMVPIISVTAITLVWSSSRAMAALMQGLDSVNEIIRKRNWIITRAVAFIYMIVLVASIILTLVLLVLSNYIMSVVKVHAPYVSAAAERLRFLKYLVPGVVLVIIFWAGYRFLPGFGVNRKCNMPGALFSAAGWIVFSYAFGIYTKYFSNYSYVYGSLTFIVLLMLWLYVCMNIFLIGAELNCMIYENIKKRKRIKAAQKENGAQ